MTPRGAAAVLGALALAACGSDDETATPAALAPAQEAAPPAPQPQSPPARLTPAPQVPAPAAAPAGRPPLPDRWRSVAVGRPSDGRLQGGVPLPAQGPAHISWDPIQRRSPSPQWRRWGTDRLVWTILAVLADFHAVHPEVKVLVGDLSRPGGGRFGPEFGGLGHRSHQNGLDVDIYYPRRDRRLIAPERPEDVDLALAQELIDRFVLAGAQFVFVGPNLKGLRGREGVVQALEHHDDHLHVRIR